MIDVQRPNEISLTELQPYINNDSFSISQKIDGHRMIVKTGAKLSCYSRQGLERSVPKSIQEALESVSSEWILDGEYLDNVYHVFDLISTPKGDISKWAWQDRQSVLKTITEKVSGIKLVRQIDGTDNKQAFYDECVSSMVEGVVFAKKAAKYRSGKTINLLKYKFTKDIDCIVVAEGVNGKSNFMLGLILDGEIIEVGKVSALTGDGPKISVGDVVTVSVLYATVAGKLYLPVKPKLRFDKSPEECSYEQIQILQTNKTIIETNN
jgi:ATP-dependent DNA ligase